LLTISPKQTLLYFDNFVKSNKIKFERFEI